MTTTTAIVANRRSRGAACQVTGCVAADAVRASPGAGFCATGAWVI